MIAFLDRWRPAVLSMLRIVVALLFVEHGLMKLFGFPAPQPGTENGLPPMLLVAALIETIAGGLVAVGLFTRAAAFLCSGMIAVGYFSAHAPQGFWPALNGGEPAVLFAFTFLYFVFAGGGAWSLDALRGSRAR